MIRSGAPDGIDGPDVQIMTAVVPLRDFALPGPDIGEGYTIISSLMLPQTRGTVRLASATPGAATLIDPCYYGEYRDLAAIAAALHAARKIGMSEPLREWRGAEVWPVPKSPRINSRTTPRTICAPTRTTRAPAAWGPTQQPLSTPNCAYTASAACALRMHRSCPGPVSANTNATVDAIAERAADLLARSK